MYTGLADVFFGTGAIDLPAPTGVAAKWRFIKGLAGNETPAAALPFSRLTACAYSGGYPAGYGHLGANYGEPLRTVMTPGTIRGISHIHPSGTGFIGTFYNYLLTAPSFSGDPEDAFLPDRMEREEGRPGYYAVSWQERGVRCELTVTRRAAHHRWTFPRAGGMLVTDALHDGLFEELTRDTGTDLCLSAQGDTVKGSVMLKGLRLFFAMRCPGAGAEAWERGWLFRDLPAGEVRCAVGLSPKSPERAEEALAEAELPFDALAEAADAAWEEALSAIEAETDTEAEKRLFYSALYHSLIKPSDWRGESFLYEDEEACMLDLATLWDQYKTQLPLLFTLYPEVSRQICSTLCAYTRAVGRLPHRFLLDRRDPAADDSQAKLLGAFVLADAMYRGMLPDVKEAAEAVGTDLRDERHYADYKESGVCTDIAHTVDLADGCAAATALAEQAGDAELAAYARALAGMWQGAFDRETGLLRADSRYYEGDHENYSFRLMHDMPTRLAIAGGRERFCALLDRFFGFTSDDPGFEGFNNETDMETPYAYHWAGRQDRLCEVVSHGMRSMFTEGRGGLPGNNDSGGLSSMYLWNVMGIFPVSGQDLMLIGVPLVRSARLRLSSGRVLTIRRTGSGRYTHRAFLNGRELKTLEFTASEMMQGGELTIEVAEKNAE